MKSLLALLLVIVTASALGQVNVQKQSGTNEINGSLVVGSGKTLTATGTGVIAATTAGNATSVPWSGVTGTPTTLTGYGITNTLSTTAPITGGGTLAGNLTLAMPAATGSVNGYLTSTDWTTFNAKQSALTFPLAATLGGTGQSTWTLGDFLYANGTNTLAKLTGNTSATMSVLTQTGNGTVSAAPVWTSTTGTGNVVRATSPTLTTPILGVATATSLTAPASTDLTLAGGSSGASLVLGSASNIATLTDSAGSANVLHVKNTQASGYSSLAFLSEAGVVSSYLGWGNSAAADPFKGNGYFGSVTGSNLVFAPGGTEKLRATSTGNLLLNTTSDMSNTTGGLTVAATGSGATATAVNTGGLRSANFGLSTVSGGASYFGGLVSAGIGSSVGSATTVYRATNAGGDITSPFMVRSGGGTQFATHVYADAGVVAQGFDAWNGTRLIEVANIQTSGVTTTAGAEVGGLSFATKPAGGPAAIRMTLEGTAGNLNLTSTTSASTSTTGALTIGNGTAATNVAIGGGNVNAGGTLTVGGTGASLTSTTANLTFGTTNTAMFDVSTVGALTLTSATGQSFRSKTNSGSHYIESARASQSTGQVGFSLVGGTSGQNWLIYQPASSDTLTFFGNSANRMTLDTSGVLSIASSSASTGVGTGALQVAGGIYAGAASVFGSSVALKSATPALDIGDNSTGPNLRLVGSSAGNLAYIQAGTSSADTNANLNISRYQTGTTAINALNVYATTATFNGAVSATNGHYIPPQTAPASPATGWVLYTDSGDGNKLKAKASTGTVVTIGTP